MATTPKKPSREKEEAKAVDMSLSPHPLCVHDALPSRKQNRENRIKNACLSKGHRNIAPSNDKRPLFVQIPVTSSASLVSTSLPIKCMRPSNFFFFRRIFPNNFLRTVFHHVRNGIKYPEERLQNAPHCEVLAYGSAKNPRIFRLSLRVSPSKTRIFRSSLLVFSSHSSHA